MQTPQSEEIALDDRSLYAHRKFESMSTRCCKRSLCEVLQAGLRHEEAQAERERGVLFDVTSSNGERFGLCVCIGDRHVYVEPLQLRGVQVVLPMVVRTHANTPILVSTLSSALRHELRR